MRRQGFLKGVAGVAALSLSPKVSGVVAAAPEILPPVAMPARMGRICFSNTLMASADYRGPVRIPRIGDLLETKQGICQVMREITPEWLDARQLEVLYR